MQDDQVEVAFCDFCGTSVPAADLGSGAALRLQGKTVGACCLTKLRPANASGGVPEATRAGGHDARLMPVAISLLAALAAATIFLDNRIADAELRRGKQHEQLVQAMGSHSDVIQGIGVDMDGAARRADLDAFGDKLATFAAAAQQDGAQQREQLDTIRRDVVALQKEHRAAAAATIDYRPLFDDLRQQTQRLAATLAEMRSAAPTLSAAPVEAATPAVPDEGPGTPDALPGALGEHVRKLGSADAAVRFEAVDELLRSKNPAILNHILPLARDPDSFVRRLTIEGLRDYKRPEAIEALLVALGDGDENVRDTAWRSLREASGQKLPFEASASKDVRARAQQRWQDWWDKNKATFGA